MTRTTNGTEKPTTPRDGGADDLPGRRAFVRLTREDVLLLRGLRELLSSEADGIVDDLCRHLRRFEPTRRRLEDPSVLDRVRKSQRAYLLSLVAGRFDEGYLDLRREMGRAHARAGLEPRWFLGTYGVYLERVLPLVVRRYGDRPEVAARAAAAVGKIMNLDAQIALDAYHEVRREQTEQQSRQLAAVGELAATIAHEVRNPLAGMKGALQILRRDLASDASRAEIVDDLVGQIVRLENLVRDLLTFARPRPVGRSPVPLLDLLDRTLRMVQDQSGAAGITIQRVYTPGTGTVPGDPHQLEQVFLNLLHNSVQAMDGGGTITVATRRDRDAVSVIVQDTGHGIPPENLERVVQPFFTTRHRGSGLGLPIVRKITQAHGGTVRIESEPGTGTTVTITLPKE